MNLMMSSQNLKSLMVLENISQPTLMVITGPTAVGKTDFTIEQALKFNTTIISADSRQFYKEMKIGTAFPSTQELATVPHFFIGNISIHDYYSVSKFEQEVLEILPALFEKNPVVILTGGSGLYIDAVCKGIDNLPDPDLEIRDEVVKLFQKEGIEALRHKLKLLDPSFYEKVDLANYKRLMRAIEVSLQMGKPYSSFLTNSIQKRDFQIIKYCLNRPREILFERINSRVDTMIEKGLVDEVKSLYKYKHLNALNTVGYKEIFDFLDDKCSLERAIEDIKTHTRRYAKRQLTWFKRDAEYNNLIIN